MSEDELLEDLGRELAASDLEALPKSLAALRLRAEVWLTEQRDDFQSQICNSERIRWMAEHKEAGLVTAIADLIAALCIGVSPITVAYLLTRRGITSFCSSFWDRTAM